MALNSSDQFRFLENGSLQMNKTDNASQTVTSEADAVRETMEHVEMYISPTLFFAGIVGNICVILTISHPKFNKMNSRFILCALAISDSILLSTNPFNQQFMQSLNGYDVRALSRLGCKFFFTMYRLGKISSSWFIVMIATDRFVSVVFPLKYKVLLTKKNILAAISCVYIIVITVASIWTFSTEIDPTTRVCIPDYVTPGNRKYHKAFVIVAACLYSLVPFLILLTLTPTIIFKLMQRHRRRREGMHSSIRRLRSTLMLTVVVISYMFWVTPITIVLIITFWTDQPIFGSQIKEMIILQGIALIFEQINNSCNFIIYVLFSSEFRRRFLERINCSVKASRRHVYEENTTDLFNISTTMDRTNISSDSLTSEYAGIWMGPQVETTQNEPNNSNNESQTGVKVCEKITDRE